MRIALGLLVAVQLLSEWCGGFAQEPANLNANAKAKAMLQYFHSLGARTDKHVVSGQFADFGSGANLGSMKRVRDKTGRWPAILGVDYADLGKGSP